MDRIHASTGVIGDTLRGSRFAHALLPTAPLRKYRLPSLALIIVGLVVIVPLLAVGVLQLEGPRMRDEALANLAAIGRLKAGQIENWLRERHGDAEMLQANQGFVADAAAWFARRDPAARARLDGWTTALGDYGYQDVELLDARDVAGLAGDPRGELVSRAVGEGRVRTSELYRDRTGIAWLDLAVPLRLPAAGGHDTVGVALLRIRADTYLFPFIQVWPTASPSAETLLVRQEGGQVLFLNELRHRRGTALNFRLPITAADLPAAIALRARRPQTLEGHDYRGVPVLAAVLPVRGTDWFLVAKVDREEVERPLLQLVTWVAMVALVAIVVIGITLLRLWRHREHGHRLELIARSAEQDRLLKLFFDLPFMGMAILDPDSRRWLHVNDRLCEMLGYGREELLADHTWDDLTHPDDLAEDMAQHRRLLAGEIEGYQIEKRFLRKDGASLDVDLAVKCVRRDDGGVEYVVKTLRDIGDRKRLEAARTDQQRSASLLDAIASASSDAIFVKDRQGKYLFYNREAGHQVGLRPEDVLGRDDATLFPDRMAERIMAQDREVMASGVSTTFEERLATVDGERTFLTTKGPLRDGTGAVIGLYGISRDISARKSEEERVRRLQEQLQLFVEHAPICIAMFDRDMNYLAYSRRWLEVYGRGLDSLMGRNHYEVHPDLPAIWHEVHARALAGETLKEDADHWVRADGGEHWLRWAVLPWKDSAGAIGGIIMHADDITESVRAEMALREREEDLNRAQVVGHIGSWRLDVRHNELTWSEENHRIFGIPPGTPMTYETFLGCVHPADRDYVDRMWREALEGAPYDIQHRLLVNGEVKWVRERAELEFDADGLLLGGFGTTQDITQLKLAEEQLHGQLRLTEAITASAAESIFVTDEKGRISFANAEAERVFGYTREEFMGQILHDLLHHRHPDGRPYPMDECANCRVYAGGQGVRHHEAVFFRKDGAPVAVSCSTAPLSLDNQATGAVLVAHDISGMKQAEQALREADQRKDEFLAMLAHELRNPLTPIRNAAHVIGQLDLAEPRLRWAQDIIERQVGHLTRLVDELLDVSRIVRGKITLRLAPVELADLVRQTRESVQPIMSAKGHRLEVRMPGERVYIQGDLVRLVQILQNLLTNAAKYTPDGGRIELLGQVQGPEMEFRVRDNGMGISPELLPSVFDLFRQGARTLDRAQGGLGIGLTLVRQLVEMHGGRVSVSSPGPGQGACFTVCLPLAAGEAPVPAPAGEAASSPARGRKLTVLVVEDDPVVAESMVVFLQVEGYQVRSAASAEAALELLGTFRPQVALVDIGLPGLDGYALAGLIRQRPDGAHLKLVAVSGYGHEEAVRRSLQAGFDRHLVKPVDPDLLCGLLAEFSDGPAAAAVQE